MRSRFAVLIGSGLKARAAARQLRVSPSTGVRWAARLRETGAIEPKRFDNRVGKGRLAAFESFFLELLEQDQDMRLYELRDALMDGEGIQVHHSTIARCLKRLGFTHKKRRWLPPSVKAKG